MVALGAVATWLSWRFFVDSRAGQTVEDAARRGAEIGQSTLWQVAEPVLDVIDEAFVVIVAVAAVVVAIMRRRPQLAVSVAIVMGGANLTTQVLKRMVLERPEYIDSIDNSLPSGHTTVAASAAVALVFVVPAVARPLTAMLGAAYTAAIGVSTMIGGWHRPADVVAAIAVTLMWAGIAVLFGAGEKSGSTGSNGRATAVTVSGLLGTVSAVAGALAGVALWRTYERVDAGEQIDGRTELLTAFGGGALGVVAAGALLFAFVVAACSVVSVNRK